MKLYCEYFLSWLLSGQSNKVSQSIMSYCTFCTVASSHQPPPLKSLCGVRSFQVLTASQNSLMTVLFSYQGLCR